MAIDKTISVEVDSEVTVNDKKIKIHYSVYGIPFCRPSNRRNSNPVNFSALTLCFRHLIVVPLSFYKNYLIAYLIHYHIRMRQQQQEEK